jgi:hypothetical protein
LVTFTPATIITRMTIVSMIAAPRVFVRNDLPPGTCEAFW